MKIISADCDTLRLPGLLALIAITSLWSVSALNAATYTWNAGGGSSDTNWSSSANWLDSNTSASATDTDIVFDLASTLSTESHVGTAFTLRSLTFTPNSSAYHLTGETITIQGQGEWSGVASIVSQGNTPTIDNNIVVNGGTEFLANRGDLRINGNVNMASGSLLLQTEVGHVTELNGTISGSGWLLLNGMGTVILGGNNNYTGETVNFNSTVLLKSDASDTGGAFGVSTSAVRISGGSILTDAAVTVDKTIILSTTEYSPRTIGGATADVSNFTKTIYNGEENAAANSLSVTAATGGRVNILNISRASGATGSSDALTKTGKGIVALTGTDNSYLGATQVTEGTLLVNGTITTGGSAVTVSSGAALGGNGVIGRDVSVSGGAVLTPGDMAADGTSLGGIMTINGNLTLADTSVLKFDFGGTVNDLVIVSGNLTLDGLLDVSRLGSLSAGIYELFEYSGTLTNNGLEVNSLPDGFSGTVVISDGVVSLSVVPEPSAYFLTLFGGFLLIAAIHRRGFPVVIR